MSVRAGVSAGVALCVLAVAGHAVADGGTGTTTPSAPGTTIRQATTTTLVSSGGPLPTTTMPATTTTVVVAVEVPEVPGGSPVVVPVAECPGAVVVVTLTGLPGGPLRGPQITVPSSGRATQTFTSVPAGSYTVTVDVVTPGVCAAGTTTTVGQGSSGPPPTNSGTTTTVGQGSGGPPPMTSGTTTTTAVASQPPVPAVAPPDPGDDPLPFTGSSIVGILQAAVLVVLLGRLLLEGATRRRSTPD